MTSGSRVDGNERIPANAQPFGLPVPTGSHLVLFKVLKPRLSLLHAAGAQIPDRLVHDDVEATVVDGVWKNARVGQTKCAPTIDSVFQRRPIIHKRAFLEHEKTLLPAMQIVGPLVE